MGHSSQSNPTHCTRIMKFNRFSGFIAIVGVLKYIFVWDINPMGYSFAPPPLETGLAYNTMLYGSCPLEFIFAPVS